MSDVLKSQERLLADLEKKHGIEIKEDDYIIAEEQLIKLGFSVPVLPQINTDINFNKMMDLPGFETALLPRWKVADITVMVVAGFLGALISVGLTDVFDGLHEKWGGKPYNKGGHGGQDNDWVPGNTGPGQFWHRLEYGHDIFNPFEINWADYFTGDSNANKMSLVKKLTYWMKHLFQDTFSKEGIPFPGSSYFRDIIKDICKGLAGNAGQDSRNIYRMLFTIKARDTVGTAFVASAMTLYVYGTEIGQEKKFFNYRYNSLTLGALIFSTCFGLTISPKKASLNHTSLLATIPYATTLFLVDKKLHNQLLERKKTIDENTSILLENKKKLNWIQTNLEEYNEKLTYLLSEIEKYHNTNSALLLDCQTECKQILADQSQWLDFVEEAFNIDKEVD